MLDHPRVVLGEDPAVAKRNIQVVAEMTNTQGGENTQVMPVMTPVPQPARRATAMLLLQTPGGPQPIPLESTMVSLGRGLSNDVILEDTRVSRHHAQLRYKQRRFWVTDLGSTNGTFVNGQRVSELALRDGDVVSLGGLELTFRDA